jgi:hypothetical protein
VKLPFLESLVDLNNRFNTTMVSHPLKGHFGGNLLWWDGGFVKIVSGAAGEK